MRFHTNFARIPHPDPNTFAGLMEVYENNYIKLKKLCGNFDILHEYSYSRVSQALDLHLHVIERTKYTITLNLTYRFIDHSDNQSKDLPNLLIRIYFDAMQAEVLHRELRRADTSQLKNSRLRNKWKDNRFLYKWLSFCIAQGHVFDAQIDSSNCI